MIMMCFSQSHLLIINPPPANHHPPGGKIIIKDGDVGVFACFQAAFAPRTADDGCRGRLVDLERRAHGIRSAPGLCLRARRFPAGAAGPAQFGRELLPELGQHRLGQRLEHDRIGFEGFDRPIDNPEPCIMCNRLIKNAGIDHVINMLGEVKL